MWVEIRNWSLFWRSPSAMMHKISLTLLVLTQNLCGAFRMHTRVDPKLEANVVHHSTRISKWGVTIYRSEKTFHLDKNGEDLRLDGYERFGILGFLKRDFPSQTGRVASTGTRASYHMPIACAIYPCQAILEPPRGRIEIETQGFKIKMELTETSNQELISKFKT